MRHEHQTITSLPPSPDEERRGRMIQYLVMMGIRVACILMLPFLRGWWLLLPAIGAIFLPYFAVVSANVVRRNSGGAVLRPGGLLRRGASDPRDVPGPEAPRADRAGTPGGPGAESGEDARTWTVPDGGRGTEPEDGPPGAGTPPTPRAAHPGGDA